MKKAIAGLLTLCILLTTPGIVSQAMTANTADKPVTKVVNEAASDKYVAVKEEDKFNTSKVYVYLTTTPYKYIIVRTMGNRNTSTYYNETKGGTANIQKGVPSSVTNYCYERRTSGAATVKVRLQLKSGSALTGTVKGVWSPDSTKSYTVVN